MAWGIMRITVSARPACITSAAVGVAVSSCGQLPATARAADQSRLCPGPGHLPATESSLTHITLVTLLPSMPAVLPQGDPLLPQPDVLPTRHAHPAKPLIPAALAVRLSHSIRNILLTSQGSVTDPAAEVAHVPEPALCLGVFLSKDQLITRGAPGDVHQLCKVTATVQLAISVEVEQVLQHLPALGAGEAGGVPAVSMSRPLSKYGN